MPRHAARTIEIPINQEQIELGVPHNSRSCPIALSVKIRFAGHECTVLDYEGRLSIEPKEAATDGGASEFAGSYEVDDSVIEWLRRYDDERNAGPATLKLLKTRNKEKGNSCELLYHDDPLLRDPN